MLAVDAPPVVYEDVETTKYEHKEGRRPLRLKTNSDHSACGNANQGNEYADKAPLSTEHKADEEEDQKNASRKQEARND